LKELKKLVDARPIQLQGLERRTNKDIDSFYGPNQILDLIRSSHSLDYRRKPEFYLIRDRSLASLEFLTCGRIHEILKVKKDQFDFTVDPDFILLKNFNVGKRKKKTIQRYGPKILDLPLPLQGPLEPFTELVLNHLENIGEDDKLFPFSRSHAYKIINRLTGMWNHFFRAQALSYYVNKLKNPLAVAQIFGVENVNTLIWYYRGAWEDYKEQFSK